MRRRTIVHAALWMVAFLVVTEWAGKLLISAGQHRRDRAAARENWERVFRHLRRPDPTLGYYLAAAAPVSVHEPGFDFELQMNAGFAGVPLRDDGIDAERPRRVLVLGDECVFGHGVEPQETFCERWEALNPDRDVINAGMPGYTPRQSLHLLERLLEAGLEVNTVVFAFNGSNDTRAEYDFVQWERVAATNPTLAGPETFRTSWVRAASEAERTAAQPLQQEARGFFAAYTDRWLALSQLLAGSAPSVETDLSLDPVPLDLHPGPGLVPSKLVMRSHGGSITEFSPQRINDSAGLPLCDLPEDAEARMRVNFPLVELSFRRARELCQERGIRFVALYLPSKEMVCGDLVVKRVVKSQRTRVASLLHRTRRVFTSACLRNRMRCIDVTPEAARRDYSGLNLFHDWTGDWNRHGHALVAEILHRELP